MQKSGKSKGQSFSVFRSAAEEADNKRETNAKREEQAWENEGGHMSSSADPVMHVPGSDLPYVVILTHHGSEATKHGFATMREAEAFIKRSTPDPGRKLSALYDRPAGD
jgi:hypothetical protein